MNTKTLANKKVRTHRATKRDPNHVKKVGRIHAFVFHPKKAQLVGYLIKRPDIALMLHRDDMFVAVDGFEEIDGDLVIKEAPQFSGKSAVKALAKGTDNIDLDDCVIWFGLPVMTENETTLGYADSVEFDPATGDVEWLELGEGATVNTLLGRKRIPADMLRGFKRGCGTRLYVSDEDDVESYGALIVSNNALEVDNVGGIAEKAGTATAIATDKAKRTYKKVKVKAKETSEKAEPKVKEVAKNAGEAVQKGLYITGRQIGRSQGMFKGFKDEFKKAMNSDTDSKKDD